jgi:hypothetical protein
MASPDVSSIMAMFPHSEIVATHAPGDEPTFASLQRPFTQLNANAASIPSSSGDGLLGHLEITIGAVAYSRISADHVAFVVPPNPGPTPPVLAPAASAAAIAENRQQWTEAKRDFQTYVAVDAACKKLLLAATDERFVMSLRDRIHGFALVRTRTIINHLRTNYGTISSADLSINDERMRAPWVVTTPIEILFAQIDDGAAYATAGNSQYSDPQLVRFGYNNIDATTRMELACRDWRMKPEIDKTWDNFKPHFKTAHSDLRLQTTTGSAGYQARANHMAEEAPAQAPIDDNDTIDGATQAFLANLANQQINSNAQVNDLSAAIVQLQLQLQAATTAITAVQQGNNRRPLRGQRLQQQQQQQQGGANNEVQRYCYTHGGRIGLNHSSQTCTSPGEGHNRAATFLNRMGGSNRHCQPVT